VEQDTVILAANSAQTSAIDVEAATPRITNTTQMTGRLVWDDDVTVRVYSPVDGRVTALPVGLGQHVAAGDTLARIDSPEYGQAQADASKAMADWVLAERNLERLKTLFAHGAAPRKDLEAAENAQASALSEKQRAVTRLALYGGQEGAVDQRFTLKAPITGVVVEKNINPGQEIRPDAILGNVPGAYQPLFVITDPTRLWVLLDVTELDMTRLRPGQAIVLRTPAYPDKSFAGMVEVVGDALDPTTRTVKVRGRVPNPDRLLKAEMYVTAEIQSDDATGVDIPASAVFIRGSQPFVFVEQSPGRYARRQIRLGPEHDGQIAVLAGVGAGQRVVTEGCLLLQAALDAENQP
jgi:cobalt-zinc-cadmium efflux system membrane fusion protein